MPLGTQHMSVEIRSGFPRVGVQECRVRRLPIALNCCSAHRTWPSRSEGLYSYGLYSYGIIVMACNCCSAHSTWQWRLEGLVGETSDGGMAVTKEQQSRDACSTQMAAVKTIVETSCHSPDPFLFKRYQYSPWRAPGSAGVIDPCGVACCHVD